MVLNLQSNYEKAINYSTTRCWLGPDSASAASRWHKASACRELVEHQIVRLWLPPPIPLPGLSRSPTDVQEFFYDNYRSPLYLCLSYKRTWIPHSPPNQQRNRPLHDMNFSRNFLRLQNFLIEHVCMIDNHPSSKSTNTLDSMSKVIGTTLTWQDVAPSTPNEETNAEQKVRVNEVTGSFAGIMANISTLAHLPSSLQGLKKDHDGIDFLLSLHTELLSQFSVP